MPFTYRQALSLGLIILLLAGSAACASRSYQARHLAAEVSMLHRGDSALEVRALLGPPDIQRELTDDGEEWLYLEHRQSRLKRTRGLGRVLGREDFHLAVITLRNEQLNNAVYRILTAEEFKEYQAQITGKRP